jgi:hypothetical protein
MDDTDLYHATSSSNTTSTLTPPPPSTGFDLFSFDLGPFINNLNYFVLAWTIFYSVLFVCDFFFWRVLQGDGELPRYHKGENSMKFAATMWWTYLVCVIFFGIFLFTPKPFAFITGCMTIIVYVLKVVVADLPKLPVVSGWFISSGGKSSLIGKTVGSLQEFFHTVGSPLRGGKK